MSIALCPLCKNKNTKPYWKIGMNVTCVTCGSIFLFNGKSIYDLGLCGESGVESSFRDFEQVVATYMNLETAQRIIGDPLVLKVSQANNDFVFTDNSGSILNHEKVHEQVQTMPTARRGFYQYAMSMWR